MIPLIRDNHYFFGNIYIRILLGCINLYTQYRYIGIDLHTVSPFLTE